MVPLDHVLEEHHDSGAQLEIKARVAANLGNRLIYDAEEFWAQ